MFQQLSLPQNWRLHFVQWLAHSPKETLASYCQRLSVNIDVNEEFVLVGLSFGGIIAVELSRIVKPKLTILISSIATKHELPAIYKFAAITKLDRLIPASLFKTPNAFLYRFFGTNVPEEKRLIRQSIRATPARFLKWAIHQIINWKNEQRPGNLVHIHGTKDHLLPVANTRADIILTGGGHLMVYDRADEISRILRERIGNCVDEAG